VTEAEVDDFVTGSPNVNNDTNTATATRPFSSQTTSRGRISSVHVDTGHIQTDIETDRQTDRQRDRQTDRQTERQKERNK